MACTCRARHSQTWARAAHRSCAPLWMRCGCDVARCDGQRSVARNRRHRSARARCGAVSTRPFLGGRRRARPRALSLHGKAQRQRPGGYARRLLRLPDRGCIERLSRALLQRARHRRSLVLGSRTPPVVRRTGVDRERALVGIGFIGLLYHAHRAATDPTAGAVDTDNVVQRPSRSSRGSINGSNKSDLGWSTSRPSRKR